MFKIDSENKTIKMSRGDTGTMTIGLSGYPFEATDVALFTVRNAANKEVKMRRELPIEDGIVTIRFVNSDTDSLDPGKYEWDIRVVLEPLYDSQNNNELYDGEEVITPEEPMILTLVGTVGQI